MPGIKGASGGRRVGAGRKRKSDEDVELDGNAGHRARVFAHPSAAVAVEPVTEFDAPDDLTAEERRVWLDLAPHAFQARTLTPATSFAFQTLCRIVVLEAEMRTSVPDRGRSAHQGLIAKLETALLRFNLNPCGKPMVEAKPAQTVINPLDKYLKHG